MGKDVINEKLHVLRELGIHPSKEELKSLLSCQNDIQLDNVAIRIIRVAMSGY